MVDSESKINGQRKSIGINRIALCLYGRFNNRYSKNSGIDGAEYIKRKLLVNENVDVFIHSTDFDNKDTILNTYANFIKDYEFEIQKNFSDEINIFNINENFYKPIEGFRTVSNSLSFFYSRKKSIDLMVNYSNHNNFKYNAAITCRFDLGQIDRYNGKQPYRVSEINFSKNYDMRYFYSAMWNQLNCGYGDQWFFSNQDDIAKLSLMYEKSLLYFHQGSDYLKFVTKGVFDSNELDEFSNEIFKNKKAQSKKYPVELAINNHLLHKYFLIDMGLYSKSKFTSDLDGVANILYTHTDYSDVWPMYFGQAEKYFQSFSKNYVFVNKLSEHIPKYYQQIVYDDSFPYVNRLINCLSKIDEDIIFINHEDMVLYDFPDMSKILGYVGAMKRKPWYLFGASQYDFIKLIRGGSFCSSKSWSVASLSRLHFWSRWIFSIQPSFWNKKRFTQLLEKHVGQHIWDFEGAAQMTCRRLMIRGAFSDTVGKKIGTMHWDNPTYPYIATAIVKGKWNTGEYGEILGKLFKEYGVDKSIRGEV
jgi:hypothetical protein